MIIALVAYGRNGEIGLEDKLLWHLPKDLRRFKSQTLDQAIVMGRKTYDSIGKPLPNRSNIVVTRNQKWKADGIEVYDNLQRALANLQDQYKQVFVIGGGEIYRQSLELVDEVWATEVHTQLKADAFFPLEQLQRKWKKEVLESHTIDEKHKFNFDFVRWYKD